MYSISQLAEIAGVSTRTLRWYEQMGLLMPIRQANGYRTYSRLDVEKLQQIMFYRELGFDLRAVQKMMSSEDFDPLSALEQQLFELKERQQQTERLIEAIEKTIYNKRKGIEMTDAERFEAFKKQSLAENEQKYGAELRELYSEDQINAVNEKYANMSQEQYGTIEELSEKLATALKAAVGSCSAESAEAKEIAELHKQWLCCYWTEYSVEAHCGITEMYIADERFKAYYEAIAPGAAEFLHDAVVYWIR